MARPLPCLSSVPRKTPYASLAIGDPSKHVTVSYLKRNGTMTKKTVTYPSGASFTDNRPGHTVTGLLVTEDPFQRANNVRAARVGLLADVLDLVEGLVECLT